MLERFISQLRRRLTLRRTLRYVGVAWVAGASSALGYALYFLVRGHSVPWSGYIYLLALPIATALCFAWWHRTTQEQSAAFADRYFGLKDILTSAWHFRDLPQATEAHQLVLDQSNQTVDGLTVNSVPLRVPRRLYAIGICLCILLIVLACLPPSSAVLAAQDLADQTLAQSAQTESQLEELVEALEAALDETEREAIDLEAIRQAVDAFEATEDPREAMRQVAQIEQHLAAQMAALEQRSDEASVRKMAEALKETPDPDARQIAEALEAKEFGKAAEKLEALTPSEAQLSELSEQAKELARLRAVSKPMAQSVAENADASDARMSPNDVNSGEPGEQSMAGLVGELDQQAHEMQDLLEAQELGQMNNAEACAACNSKLRQSMEKLGDKLGRMQARQGAQTKLAQMRRMLSQAQGNQQMAGAAQMPGGQGAGEGSDSSRRGAQDALTDNQQFSQLEGIKNAGPSLSKVEDAAEGSGVSGRSAGTVERSYERQFESFVQRDDIPDAVKFAVGDYFESIHQYEAPTTGTSE